MSQQIITFNPGARRAVKKTKDAQAGARKKG
jgi:hypothetical protein